MNPFEPILLTTAVFCGIIAVLVFRDSYENGSDLIIAVKPIKRHSINLAKYLVFSFCCLIYLLGFILLICPMYIYQAAHLHLTSSTNYKDTTLFIVNMSIGIIVLQIFFGSIAIIVSVFKNKLITILTPTSIVVGAYIISLIIDQVATSPTDQLNKQGISPSSQHYLVKQSDGTFAINNGVTLSSSDGVEQAKSTISHSLLTSGNGISNFVNLDKYFESFFNITTPSLASSCSVQPFGDELSFSYFLNNSANRKWTSTSTTNDILSFPYVSLYCSSIDKRDFILSDAAEISSLNNSSIASYAKSVLTQQPTNALFSYTFGSYLSELVTKYITLKEINDYIKNPNFQRYINWLIYGSSEDTTFNNSQYANGINVPVGQDKRFYLTDKQMDDYIKHHGGDQFYDGYREQLTNGADVYNKLGDYGWGHDTNVDQYQNNLNNLDTNFPNVKWQFYGHKTSAPPLWFRNGYFDNTHFATQANAVQGLQSNSLVFELCHDLLDNTYNDHSFIYYDNPDSPFYHKVFPDDSAADNQFSLDIIAQSVLIAIYQKHLEHFWNWYVREYNREKDLTSANLPEWTKGKGYTFNDSSVIDKYKLVWPTEWNQDFLSQYVFRPYDDWINYQIGKWETTGGYPLDDESKSLPLQQYLALLNLYYPYGGNHIPELTSSKQSRVPANQQKRFSEWPVDTYLDYIGVYYWTFAPVFHNDSMLLAESYASMLNYYVIMPLNITHTASFIGVICCLFFIAQAVIFTKIDIK